MDFFPPEHLPVISTFSSLESPYGSIASQLGAAVPSSTAWPAANRALYVPVTIRSNYLVRLLWWANGATVTGNIDCGIYTNSGTLIASAGSTAQATINVIQTVTLGTPILLPPGSYQFALIASSASATMLATSSTARCLSIAGVTQQATSVPLPATYSPATVASNYFPMFGVASATVI